jgi:predicted DNA-binding transcriptional regulator AlpA
VSSKFPRIATISDRAASVEPVSALDPVILSLISAADAANRLSVSNSTFYRLVAVGAVPKSIHVVSRALSRVEELEGWVLVTAARRSSVGSAGAPLRDSRREKK